MKYKIGSVYLAFLGIFTFLSGASDLILAVSGGKLFTDFLIAGGSMWSLWKGFILFFSGIFMVIGSISLKDIHGLGKSVLGVVMLWIVAGSNIFSRITSSIPGEETWFKSFEDFLSFYALPYEPELWLLPFSLIILYFIARASREKYPE